jgi:KUP system potassium uptake protein
MTQKRAAVRKSPEKSPRTARLALGALGVVFGDIGTSPLYALRQCFQDMHQSKIEPAAVTGILSLIFWSLILVVCIKYVTFIMRADHEGEGGTLAMLALIHTRKAPRENSLPGVLTLTVLFGSALLYGDGVITPSISVLSAVEGLKIATPSLQKFIVPIALAILVGLFLLQRRGTGQMGFFFGPIMALWFLAVAGLGIGGIAQAPQILEAVNPADAASFLIHHGGLGIVVLGGVVLCFSGAEALFADLGHFGRMPIVLAWYGLVLPALLLNYFGEGALMLLHPEQTDQPFFMLVPHVLLFPMVGLATLATVIASQALISGVFSLTQQAIHMGYFPRFEIVHTSQEERGQIYIASINYALMVACVGVVLAFQSSERLGGAYGLAVIGTMTITSLVYYVVLRRVWNWPRTIAVPLVGFFLLVDGAFLAGNLIKILSGAWVPLVFAAVVFGIFWIWTAGRARYHQELNGLSMPIKDFAREMKKWEWRHDGTAVFLTTHPNVVPLVGKKPWLLAHARYEQVLLLTVLEEKRPYIRESDATKVEQLAPDFWRITASFGFMQHPDLTHVLEAQPCEKLKIDWDKLVCYLPEPTLAPKRVWWKQLVQEIYEFLARNSLSPAKYFRVPPREIIHVGVRLDA